MLSLTVIATICALIALAWTVRSLLSARAHNDRLSHALSAAEAALAAAQLELTGAHVELARVSGEAAARDEAERRLADSFASLSRDALDRNTHSFLELAATRLGQQQAEAKGDLDQRRIAVEQLVAPLREALDRVEQGMQGIEKARTQAYGGLLAQVRSLSETQDRLRTETANLAGALRSPQARGRWGEVQLRRVVEMAGMLHHCDFVEQATLDRAGIVQRPDIVINLPGQRSLAVDSKVPLSAYLQAHETDDDEKREILLREHSRALRTHVKKLADKAYWEQFPDAPDFVIMFIPGEPFLAAAFEHEPNLFEYAHSQRVLLATPTTLIALLQSVALGWRQESIAEDARQVCEVGRELYKRLLTMGENVTAVGKALDKTVEAYNRSVGSLESRVLVQARRLASFDLGAAEIPAVPPVDRAVTLPQAPDLTLFNDVA